MRKPPRKQLPVGLLIVAYVLLCLVLIGGWFGARMLADSRRAAPLPPSVATPAPITVTPTPQALPETTPDPRTPWQIRFAEHFTDQVVVTENSYTSPTVAVTVTEHRETEGDGTAMTYYVADIYIGSIDCFRTEMAETPPNLKMAETLPELSERSNAVVAINGDYCGHAYGGMIVRNGVVWSAGTNYVEICALYADGTMETMPAYEFDMEQAKDRGVYQVLSFGPSLLNEAGEPRTLGEMLLPSPYLRNHNPRTAIGYYEPGHYCFVVVDGRQPGHSQGAKLEDLSRIFQELGCSLAFNLDGGGSSMMAFRGNYCSRPSGGDNPRKLSDILLITDAAPGSLFPAGTQEVSP